MKKITLLTGLIAGVAMLFSQASLAMSDCGEIILGSAISLTGKYASNGVHAKNGYEYAISKIKEKEESQLVANAITSRSSITMTNPKATGVRHWPNG